MRRTTTIVVVTVLMVVTAALAAPASGGKHKTWSPAEDIETFGAGAHPNFNTEFAEGCPFISPDGKRFFLMSTRPGGVGGQDIWVSTRKSKNHAWSEPVNVGEPINSPYNDFCPTIAADGKTFYFASNRPGHCGETTNADLYTARLDRDSRAKKVLHLGCKVNSAWDEHSPFPARIRGMGRVLLYSSARPANASDAPGDHDLYASPMKRGKYQSGAQLKGINTAANEGQPNLRVNGREIFFWSDRDGTLGGPDIYTSKLGRRGFWSTPKNLGASVNSGAPDTRPSLSRNGKTLYFGSGRTGGGDIYVVTR